MTWVDWLVVALAVDRLLFIGWAAYQGGKAALREARESVANWPVVPPDHRKASKPKAGTNVPDMVEVASDHVVALDYSSGPKRH